MLRVDTSRKKTEPNTREEWESQRTTRLPRFAVELPDEPSESEAGEEQPEPKSEKSPG